MAQWEEAKHPRDDKGRWARAKEYAKVTAKIAGVAALGGAAWTVNTLVRHKVSRYHAEAANTLSQIRFEQRMAQRQEALKERMRMRKEGEEQMRKAMEQAVPKEMRPKQYGPRPTHRRPGYRKPKPRTKKL